MSMALKFNICLVLLICIELATLSQTHYHHYTKNAAVDRPQSQRNTNENDNDYWYADAEAYIQHKLHLQSQLNRKRAKNVILFVGDGMSMQTITATRAYLGDTAQQLSFDRFPNFGLSKTYCIDQLIPDSGCTATALLAGVKTNYGVVGVSAQVQRSDCGQRIHKEYQTTSIANWAQDAGKWTGLVTTARVTHATPAAMYAHTSDRNWEYDGAILKSGCNPKEVIDVARQLIEWPVGKAMRVILGGGRRSFLNETMQDVEGERGRRSDGRNLIEQWLSDKREMKKRPSYVTNREELLKAQKNNSDFVLGLFSSSHCPYHEELKQSSHGKMLPSLSEMTEAAIKLLSRNKQGYFLLIEGAKIDLANHENKARRSLEETAEFSRAVELARSMTSEEDTLIVVTADHANTMTINGYTERSSDIFGLNTEKGNDGLPYTTLSYANGGGYYTTYADKKERKDLSHIAFNDPQQKYMATVPLAMETHGADDVGIFASGPFAHYFSGSYEQSNIPLLMSKAADIGPYAKQEDDTKKKKKKQQ